MDVQDLVRTDPQMQISEFLVHLPEYGDPDRNPSVEAELLFDTGAIQDIEAVFSENALDEYRALLPDLPEEILIDPDVICLWILRGQLSGHQLRVHRVDGFEIVLSAEIDSGKLFMLIGGLCFEQTERPFLIRTKR